MNDDGVVLLPDYMAKAVMSKDEDITEVAEVEVEKPKKQQQLRTDPSSTQMFDKTKGATMKEQLKIKSYPNSDDDQVDYEFRMKSDRSLM